MKALVTGANGFLGSYLVDQLLEQGYEVRGMTRRRDDAISLPNLEYTHGDIRDEEAVLKACTDVDMVFHTAAISGIWGPWKTFHSINTIGSKNVVNGCIKNNVPKLIYTSSPSVTFDGDHQINVNETAPYARKWMCHYPHSKALAEKHVLESNDPSEGLMTCALRPHLIWGPRDRHLIPRLLDRARAKKLRRVGDGKNLMDTIYVENAATAHIQAAEAMEPGSPVCGSAYFLSQDDPVNCWAWINEILELAGVPRIRRSISYPAAHRIGWVFETFYEMFDIKGEPRMTRFLAAQLAKSHYFDISRAKQDFGYSPRISTAEGMKRLEESILADSAKGI